MIFDLTNKELDTKINMSSVHTPISTIPNNMKFVFGGSAGMFATSFVQPLDLIKNRMQVCVASGPSRTIASSNLYNNETGCLYILVGKIVTFRWNITWIH